MAFSQHSQLEIPILVHEPVQNRGRTFIRREDRIEQVLNPTFVHDEHAPLQKPHSSDLEDGKVERLGECESFVRKEGKRQMESRGRLSLIVDRLRRESK